MWQGQGGPSCIILRERVVHTPATPPLTGGVGAACSTGGAGGAPCRGGHPAPGAGGAPCRRGHPAPGAGETALLQGPRGYCMLMNVSSWKTRYIKLVLNWTLNIYTGPWAVPGRRTMIRTYQAVLWTQLTKAGTDPSQAVWAYCGPAWPHYGPVRPGLAMPCASRPC